MNTKRCLVASAKLVTYLVTPRGVFVLPLTVVVAANVVLVVEILVGVIFVALVVFGVVSAAVRCILNTSIDESSFTGLSQNRL